MFTNQEIEFYMNEALKEAKAAFDVGEVPVGAIIVQNKKITGRGHNLREFKNDISSHAEIEAIKNCESSNSSWKVDDATIFVTLEPCLMCFGAILQAGIKSIYFGAKDEKDGAITKYGIKNEAPLIYQGILEVKCQSLIKSFFELQRKIK